MGDIQLVTFGLSVVVSMENGDRSLSKWSLIWLRAVTTSLRVPSLGFCPRSKILARIEGKKVKNRPLSLQPF